MSKQQGCWVHKTKKLLNAMPKSVQVKAKTTGHLHDIWPAETKTTAGTAFVFFVETYDVRWDRDGLLRKRRLIKRHQLLRITLNCLMT
jgi:putative transposase